jgi:hypothetical protein
MNYDEDPLDLFDDDGDGVANDNRKLTTCDYLKLTTLN